MNILFQRLYSEYIQKVSKKRDELINFQRNSSWERKVYLKRLVYLLKTRKRNLGGYYSAYGDRLIKDGRKETTHERQVRIGAQRAREVVSSLVHHKKLPSLRGNHIDCTDCDSRATEYEHRDYNKPEDVEPICRRCNILRGPAIYV